MPESHGHKCMKAKPHPQKAKAVIQPSFLGDILSSHLHFCTSGGDGEEDHCLSISSVAAGQILSVERVETKYLRNDSPGVSASSTRIETPSMELCHGD